MRRGRCRNTLMDLAEFLGPIEREGMRRGEPVRTVLESTTNSRAIQRMLTQYGAGAGIDMTAEVLDARKIRIIAESVCKCDRLDAQVLNDLARSNLKLPVCYMPDDEEFALREHLRARSDLVRMRTMLKNRVHAVLHRRGILAPTADLFTRTGRTYLAQLKLEEAGRAILDRYLETMDQIHRAVEESTASLRELMRRPRWSKAAALLLTMPGIGLITALTILAELGDLTRFRSRAAVANYAGLVPIIRDSDQKHFAGGISHRGSNHLRAVLGEAAWMAFPRVPVYRHLFERIEQKKNKATAIVAVARRMLEDAFTMLKRDEAFRYVEVPMADTSQQVGTVTPARESRSGRKTASSVAG
ncbi:MAG: IS110 family transposase [Phycisphaerae bacterium]